MKLCVLFPGMGYHADKPLLYYSAKLALSRGDDVIPLKATPHKDCAAETQLDFSSDCTEILQAYCRMARNFCAR